MAVLWVLIGLYVALILVVSWISVHPVRTPLFLSPGAMGAPQRDVEYTTEDGIAIRAWWMEPPARASAEEPTTVAILLHGYLMTRSELTPLGASLWKEGCACLLPDFRAHGRSGGSKCGIGWLERKDAAAAIAWVQNECPMARIVLIGSSMGAAASSFAAAEVGGVHALVLDCGYSRLSSAALGWWRFLGGQTLAILFAPTVLFAAPFVGVNPFRVDVAKALRKANLPTLLIHGANDRLALPREAERNLAACGEKGKLVWMPNSNHSEGRWVHPDLYVASLLAFLREQELI